MSVHATSLVYKEALSLIEEKMPGSRIVFYQGFLDEANPLRRAPGGKEERGGATGETGGAGDGGPEPGSASSGTPSPCAACGAPTYAETCSYCRLKELVRKRREERSKGAAG